MKRKDEKCMQEYIENLLLGTKRQFDGPWPVGPTAPKILQGHARGGQVCGKA